MEIQGTDGSKTRLKSDSTTIFGRKNLSNSTDLSISRNHISFDLISSPNSPINRTKNPRVSFQVIGKNPIWIYNKFGDKKVTTLKGFQKGELGIDDLFCISGKNPVWFALKKIEDGEFGEIGGKRLDFGENFDVDLSECLGDDYGVDDDDCDLGFDSVDVSNIDPVQEFGFLVIGHEFDQYPKKMIRHIRNWDWFLDDPIKGSDDEESEETIRKKAERRKRKKTSGDDDVDDEWTAESEGDELPTKATKIRKQKYHTRSKDPSTSHNKRTGTKTSSTTSRKVEKEEYEDDDEDEEDQTLGGFIVDDEIVEDDEEDAGNEIDDDEEEEFVEDEDEM
ncbi:hypothetical protein RND81_01G062800 [Saponaria officinalis]|uniref:Uncharacterized protein n=1 Tax=Saponaria officinalis TaxID=3572 RepID=A0AAW1N8X7_SAPOF